MRKSTTRGTSNSVTVPGARTERLAPTASITPLLLTSSEVAQMLAISNSTLCRWRAAGKGPKVYWLSPDSPRYRERDVLDWLESVAA